MYPNHEILLCKKCGYAKEKDKPMVIVTKKQKKEVTVIEKENDSVLPRTKIKCPHCNHNEAFWILRQMRGSDEPESRFYTCTKCGYKWRED
jgi:DNA-directed RNA polymerase subunit M